MLPLLKCVVEDIPLVFMLNHWNLPGVLRADLGSKDRYLVGFPSQIGGGRHDHRVTATVFPHGTVLESDTAAKRATLATVEALFTSAGLTVRRQRHMTDWLPVHIRGCQDAVKRHTSS